MLKIEQLSQAFEGSNENVIYCSPGFINSVADEIANLTEDMAEGSFENTSDVGHKLKNSRTIKYKGITFVLIPINDFAQS